MSQHEHADQERASWPQRIGPAGLVSLASLACATCAISLAIAGELRWSVWAAIVAFILDMLDGLVARRTGTSSEFGRQLDSMIDVVGYSVYAAVLTGLVIIPGPAGWAVGFVIVATGMLRLIAFNIEGFVEEGAIQHYRGVVVCHLSLAAIASTILTGLVGHHWWLQLLLGALLVVLSLGQLATFRFRKTGRQLLWASSVVPLAIGAWLWL